MGCGSVSVRSAFSCHSAGEVFTYFPVPRYKCAHGHVRQRLCTGPGGSHDGPGNTQELHKTLPDRKCVGEFSPSRTTTAVVIAVIDVVVVVAIGVIVAAGVVVVVVVVFVVISVGTYMYTLVSCLPYQPSLKSTPKRHREVFGPEKKRRMLDRQEAEGVQNTRGVLEEKTVL